MSEFWIGMGVGMLVGLLWAGFMRARAERRDRNVKKEKNHE
jgi:hypothetical protein